MADWTDYWSDSWDYEGLTNTAILNAYQAITGCVNQKSEVHGLTTFDIPAPTDDRLTIHINLYSRIKTLCPLFVNHTVNDGDFTGLEEIPMWTESELKDYGQRTDGTTKGLGYFGEIYNPDGTFSTELSSTVDDRLIPLLVPTLTDAEITALQADPDNPSSEVITKAVAYADYREANELSVFAEDGEQSPRDWMITFTSPLTDIKYWISLMYTVLNKMRWIEGSFWSYGKKVIWNQDRSGIEADTWSEFIEAFTNGAWSFYGYGIPIEYQVQHTYGATYDFFQFRNANTGQHVLYLPTTVSYDYKFTADCYCVPSTTDWYWQTFAGITEESAGVLTKVKTIARDDSETSFELFDWNDFSPDGKTEPAQSETYGFAATLGPYVFKFDVADGFTFRGPDWD